MTPHHRRIFLINAGLAGCAFVTTQSSLAAEPKLSESDAYPKSMGFKLDTKTVDKTRYPRHTVEQYCGRCQLYDGSPTDAAGPCSFYGGRIVPTNGWCKNFKLNKSAA
jgi:hypothetical protein